MSDRILFISDLHLQESRPDLTAALLSFLKRNSSNSSALYILGDLFEVWIGDDDKSELMDTVAEALTDYARSGADVFLMHGNRDFLLGQDYASRCQATLIHEPHILTSASHGPITLLHGDTLCTDDTEYQQFRTLVRDPAWQREFLSKSLDERRTFAAQARAQSQQATASKQSDIMDVNPEAVASLVTHDKVSLLIHGHTHRPAKHPLPGSEAKAAQRIVLGDWDKTAWYVELTPSAIDLIEFPL